MKRKEIENLEDVKFLVDTFYDKIRKDELLADIFNEVIQDQWPEHLQTMYTFWQTILLNERTYYGSPFPPHANLPVEWKHFQRRSEERRVGKECRSRRSRYQKKKKITSKNEMMNEENRKTQKN